MTMHPNEIPAGLHVVRSLLAAQRPDIAELPISHVGGGTDNTMYRVGEALLIRMPRTTETAAALQKELKWLPRLGPLLNWKVPEALYVGEPADEFPLPWAIYRWLEGESAADAEIEDWVSYGRDLATFVRDLHSVDLMGAKRGDGLSWYRGGLLQPHDEWLTKCLDDVRTLTLDLDVDRLQRLWHGAIALPAPSDGYVWLHGDLKPTNVLVRSGRVSAVIDFGGLSVGYPDAEHAPAWDLPAAARASYRAELDVNEHTWSRARAWAILVAASSLPYYWNSFPTFASECLRRLQAVVTDAA